MVDLVRLKHFLDRALRLGQARGRALRLGQATGPSDRVYELNKDNNVFKTIRIKKRKVLNIPVFDRSTLWKRSIFGLMRIRKCILHILHILHIKSALKKLPLVPDN